MIYYPNAKINIGLEILSKRKDGLHNISSFFVPIPLYDILEVNIDYSLSSHYAINYSGLKFPHITKDLVIQAYDVLSNDFKLDPVNIHLHKNIPVGAGLGGGSSDGTSMLILLNDLFNLSLTTKQLLKYTMMLGSDCSFFLWNTFSHVSNCGSLVSPIKINFPKCYLIIIKPQIHVSTYEVFKNYILDKEKVEPTSFDANMNTWKNRFVNDLELITLSLYPELQQIKKYLYSLGAIYVSMTGSGSAIYGVFQKNPHVSHILYSDMWIWEGYC